MKIYYEGLVDNHILMQRFWEEKLAEVAQMDVGPEFWAKLHNVIAETNHEFRHGKMRHSSVECGKPITGFHAQVMNSGIVVNPLFGED